ncbi:MAG TPA: outer membrane lipoprotein carrier protein LolA [Thermoanaerobaculaceae bacterium]|nr:outer membrane lipoprotein carrier protein LolA [Thermoanaerobaculaceae bacterium]HPS78493.1 outer membrane lipoprotein carrier protein LolA [Thermoanaerobaculaceae bacterium]
MVALLALLLAASPPPTQPSQLATLAARMAAAPAWQADFVQDLVPAGFSEGTREAGTLVVAPPARLRFDYGADGRIFAVSGSVARQVDLQTGGCDAVLLSASTWSRLPLATILDPAAAAGSFVISEAPGMIGLTPREPIPELATVEIRLDQAGNVASVMVLDQTGNRNTFSFSRWRRLPAQPVSTFEPALPGHVPCRPEGS